MSTGITGKYLITQPCTMLLKARDLLWEESWLCREKVTFFVRPLPYVLKVQNTERE